MEKQIDDCRISFLALNLHFWNNRMAYKKLLSKTKQLVCAYNLLSELFCIFWKFTCLSYYLHIFFYHKEFTDWTIKH